MWRGDARISEEHRVAVLLLSIDAEIAARVMALLPEHHIEALARAMRELSEVRVDNNLLIEVQREAVHRLEKREFVLGDPRAATHRLLERRLRSRTAAPTARASRTTARWPSGTGAWRSWTSASAARSP
jgi:flagellar motor switch protein FliG